MIVLDLVSGNGLIGEIVVMIERICNQLLYVIGLYVIGLYVIGLYVIGCEWRIVDQLDQIKNKVACDTRRLYTKMIVGCISNCFCD